jgi:hypothetical protein
MLGPDPAWGLALLAQFTTKNGPVAPGPAVRRAGDHAVTAHWTGMAAWRLTVLQWPDWHSVFMASMVEARERCSVMFRWQGLTDVGYRRRGVDFGWRGDVSSTAVCSGGRQRWCKAPAEPKGWGEGQNHLARKLLKCGPHRVGGCCSSNSVGFGGTPVAGHGQESGGWTGRPWSNFLPWMGSHRWWKVKWEAWQWPTI